MADLENLEHLSNLERFYIARYDEAWEKFQSENEVTEECKAISTDLLLNADLPIGLRAGLHFLLAYGTENYVYHAHQALHYCQELADRIPDDPSYKETVEEVRTLVKAAEDRETFDESQRAGQQVESGQPADPDVAGAASEVQDVVQQLPGQLPAARSKYAGSQRRTRTDSGYHTAASDRPTRDVKPPERYGSD